MITTITLETCEVIEAIKDYLVKKGPSTPSGFSYQWEIEVTVENKKVSVVATFNDVPF